MEVMRHTLLILLAHLLTHLHWCSDGLGDAEAGSSLRSFGRSLDARVIGMYVLGANVRCMWLWR
jgi:hypothetical protein